MHQAIHRTDVPVIYVTGYSKMVCDTFFFYFPTFSEIRCVYISDVVVIFLDSLCEESCVGHLGIMVVQIFSNYDIQVSIEYCLHLEKRFSDSSHEQLKRCMGHQALQRLRFVKIHVVTTIQPVWPLF